MRTLAHAIVVLLLAAPTLARALPPPVGFSLATGLSATPRGAAARFTAATSCWLDGDLDGEVRLGFGSADRAGGRGADALTAALGLRWGPDVGRWRPVLGVEAGARVPLVGHGVVPTASARLGVELFARRDFSVSVEAGWRWTSGAAAGAEAMVGLGYYL
jgi:hypothetical protein